MTDEPKIYSLGDGAVNVHFGDGISVQLNEQAISLADQLELDRFPGFIETVPAFSSTAVFYDPLVVRASFPLSVNAFEAVSDLVRTALRRGHKSKTRENRLIEIPTDFSEAAAIDLSIVSEFSGLDESEVVDLFTSRTYRVYMLGFLPGFTYMAEVDDRIAAPRKDSPRKKVPKGSVGIAGRQTGIYPLESPGGWQIVGRTSIPLFSPDTDPMSLLRPGDEVRFVRV